MDTAGVDEAPDVGAVVLRGVSGGRGGSLRPHSTPATLLWLEANYEMADGVCIPRSTLYNHYVHFCAANGLQPVNAASFGKIIRQQFPLLTTRRLGTRGQSRYHYYGIAIRETSVYFEVSYSKKGFGVSEGRRDSIRQNGFSQTRYKLSAHLPEFPSIRDLCLPDGVPADRVSSFLMMYRTHCQRIFDAIMRASMDEVHNFILHFWQGMPPHLIGILSTNVVVNMVGVCDSILYRTICNVLMQYVLQALPDNLLQVIRKFALELEVWLHLALEDLPPALKNMKMSLAHSFSKMLKRQSSLHHLCQAAQMVIFNPDLTNQMLLDLRKVDLQAICRQTMYTMDNMEGSIVTQLITGLFHEFEQLLEGQAAIETYVEWLESIIDRCVLHPANSTMGGSTPCLRHLARKFLLAWTGFGTRVIRDMTLHSAPSFGSFHLLHLMFDDCIFHLVDILHLEDRAKEMLRNANLNTQPDFDMHWENASELAHQGAVHGEFVTATETFQGPLHYETDFRIGCKNQGRNYIYQNCINQSCMDTDSTIPDMMPTHNQSVIDKSEKLVNSTVLSYGSCDENQGICSQFGISRRAEQTGMSSSDSHLYQDFSVGMNSHSSGGYYHYYNSNTSYPNNRY